MPLSDETKRKWKAKAEIVAKAQKAGFIELTEWEATFLVSITEQLGDGKELSFKQSCRLNELYDRI